jgi:predicted permease
LLLLYFAVRNIGKALREFIFSTYLGAANITFFIPFVSYLLRGKSLKALGTSLRNNFFLISSYLYFIATPLALFSRVKFDIRPLDIIFKIIATLAYALALFGLAFILLGFLYFPESPKPAGSVDNI